MIKIKDMQELKKQQENVGELLRLCKENPELPIIASVENEVVGNEDYGWWMGYIGSSRVDEVVAYDDEYSEGALVYKSEETYNDLYEMLFGYDDDFNDELTDEEIKAKVDSAPWLKCIVVHILTPEYDIPSVQEWEAGRDET